MLRRILGIKAKEPKWRRTKYLRDYYDYVFSQKYSFKNEYKGLFEPPFTFYFFGDTYYKFVMNKARDMLDIELPNATLPILLGIDKEGRVRVSDLTKLRHILVSGSQGGGKSIGVLSLLTSLIYLAEPSLYHLHVFDPKGDLYFLKNFGSYYNTVDAMEKGILTIKKAHKNHSIKRKSYNIADIEEYNEVATKPLKYNIIFVDEFFFLTSELPELWAFAEHLMAVGRADGFYFILTTQRADHNSVSTNARQNATTRMSFWQPDARESKIAGVEGAEKIKRQGDFVMRTAMISSLPLSIPPTSHSEMRMFLKNLEEWASLENKKQPDIKF